MFDSYVDRKGTNSAKIDEAIIETSSEEVISLSVADMDFKASHAIMEALSNKVNHGIYGYTNVSNEYQNTIKNWIRDNYQYEIFNEWIVFMPRIIQAVSLLVQSNSNKRDRVVIQTPLYSPLTAAIELNNRNVVENTLIYKDNNYKIDFLGLEDEFKKGVKIFIFCSPHNPVGRVWNEIEVKQLVNLCKKYDVLLISDEVHSDFTWEEEFVSVGKFFNIYDKMVVCNSPGKTFNLPGVEASNIIIPNDKLRKDFNLQKQKNGFHNPNYFAETALQAAYTSSDDWLDEVKIYIRDNYHFAKDFINNNLSDFKVVHSEGTYLMWIDFTNTDFDEKSIKEWLFNKLKIAVSLGSSFGETGNNFFRINIALPRKTLERALNRMANSYKKMNKEK